MHFWTREPVHVGKLRMPGVLNIFRYYQIPAFICNSTQAAQQLFQTFYNFTFKGFACWYILKFIIACFIVGINLKIQYLVMETKSDASK